MGFAEQLLNEISLQFRFVSMEVNDVSIQVHHNI